MRKPLLALLAAALLSVAPAFAGDLKFSSLLGDNMVLQQQTEARIWGTAGRGATVRVSASWLAEPLSAKADGRGRWELLVPTPAATFEPQTLVAESGSERIQAANILIGEVWFCSVQSNM